MSDSGLFLANKKGLLPFKKELLVDVFLDENSGQNLDDILEEIEEFDPELSIVLYPAVFNRPHLISVTSELQVLDDERKYIQDGYPLEISKTNYDFPFSLAV